MDIAGSRVLVTGGLGFIGSHIVESLLEAGATHVRILDNYRSGSEQNIAAVSDRVDVVRGDILNVEDLRAALRGVDWVSHMAAQLEITRAIDDPVEDLTTNTVGTLNLFAVCAELGVRRIIQASSAGVYGQAVTTPQREDEHPTEPNWAYGVSKLANEKYAAIMREVHGLEITSLRYGIVYGPREWYGRVLTIFLKRALQRLPLVVFGDGEQIRDFVFVDDVVAMHNRCLEVAAAGSEIFNVATGSGTTVNELARMVIDVTGVDVEVVHEDVPEGATSKLLDRRRLPQELKTLVQSRDKAERLVGWVPKIALGAGLAQEWEWLTAHPDRWTTMAY
jgi:UDP-glucose 4-epimerase